MHRGGVFAVLAEYIIGVGGSVYGVKMNEAFEAIFIRIDSTEELFKIQGSKYVQSHTDMI